MRRCWNPTPTSAAMAAFAIVMVVLLAATPRAEATWSVVGVDPETGEVGVAIASCVPASVLGDLERPLEPVILVPGVGAGVSQAALNSDAPPEIRAGLELGLDPDIIIANLTDPAFDDRSEARQHAVVVLAGERAGYTGSSNLSEALDAQAEHVSAQGNILVSQEVIGDAIRAFEGTTGDLATRLVAALEAGALAGGDSRCGEQTALFAQVVVAGPDDLPEVPSVLLTVAVVEGDGENPVATLVSAFDAGTRQHVVGPSLLQSFGLLAIAVVGLLLVLVVGTVLGIRRRRANRRRI